MLLIVQKINKTHKRGFTISVTFEHSCIAKHSKENLAYFLLENICCIAFAKLGVVAQYLFCPHSVLCKLRGIIKFFVGKQSILYCSNTLYGTLVARRNNRLYVSYGSWCTLYVIYHR